MSDYGDDDYSDYGDAWFYVEDEYMPADDLAEHVVNSPPPTTYGDPDAVEDWDRFEYFNDLEYASDGYDDENFYTHKPEMAQTGQKRKRGVVVDRGRKKQKLGENYAVSQVDAPKIHSPVVWRSQADRGVAPKTIDDNIESYALLKDWRERLADTPAWASGSQRKGTSITKPPRPGKGKASRRLEPISLSPGSVVEEEEEQEQEEDDEGDTGIDPSVLMEALQKNLGAAGGPLSGMDPEQLLQFVMRMMNDQGAGDEIAGELADDILGQGEDDQEDEEGDAPADLLSWLSKQRNSTQAGPSDPDAASAVSIPKSPEVEHSHGRPPTPPSSEANRSYYGNGNVDKQNETKAKNADAFKQNNSTIGASKDSFNRKRKADDDVDVPTSEQVPKKRATRTYDAPTSASQARSAPSKATRSGRAKRS